MASCMASAVNISFRVDFWQTNVNSKLKSRSFSYTSRCNDDLVLENSQPTNMLRESDEMCTEVYLFCRNYKLEPVDCARLMNHFITLVEASEISTAPRNIETDPHPMSNLLRECIDLQLWAHQRAYVDAIVRELTRLYEFQLAYENKVPSDPAYIVNRVHDKYNVVTYLIAHEAVEGAAADEVYRLRNPWAQLLRIHSTKFFESIVFSDHLPARVTDWEHADFVLISTYKSANLSHFNVFELRRLVDVAVMYKYDVIPLFRGYRQLLPGAISLHNVGFKYAWYALLNALGYADDVITKYSTMDSFYRNSYLIRPPILKQLMVFMSNAMEIATKNETVNELLSANSEYYGKFEIATRIFSTFYFQLHPFLFERLPIFFMHVHNISMCHGHTECQNNFPN